MPEPVTLAFALVILYSLVVVEALLVWLAVRYARSNPGFGRRWFVAAEQWPSRVAPRRGWCVLAVGALALAGRPALAPALPIREPLITDEFSYLLGGDSYASGRLTNPPHPMWRHLETIHVLGKPTYMSIYAPAQG